MRRQSFAWTYVVVSVLCIMYGTYFAIRKYNENYTHFVVALIVAIFGGVMSLTFIILYLISANKKVKEIKKNSVILPKEETVVDEEEVKEEKEEEKPAQKKVESAPIKEYREAPAPKLKERSEPLPSGYVKLVGYGPILELHGNRIRDMRSNTYYRIEHNYVYIEGSGMVYEIRGNKIKNAFGGFLYEINGDSISKTFGGYFASRSGSYITKNDLSEKYELTNDFRTSQLLAIIVLIFGTY